MKLVAVIAAVVLIAGSAVVAVVVLSGDDEPREERIGGRTEAGASRARARYLDRDGCIHHVRARYSPDSGTYALTMPAGARPLTIEAVARGGHVLKETRLGPEGARGQTPADAPPVCSPPGMGVACLTPNRVDCDEVGFSVMASVFVSRVTATIAGRKVTLDRREPPETGRDGLSMFGTTLKRAGLRDGPLKVQLDATGRWLGEPPVTAPVRLDFRFRDGREATRTYRVRLGAGWG
jgi:hypothetical protein